MKIYAAQVENMIVGQEELVSMLDSNRRDKIHMMKNGTEILDL